MREYFRYFRFWFLALGIVIALWIAVFAGKRMLSEETERTNTECVTEERVFDYADVLTEEEENRLREQIAKREKQTASDIVIVTLNESLKDYARTFDPYADYSEFTMIYADNFYDEGKFGYNKPVGDGVLLLDNIYREDDGKVYTWLCTTGKVEDRYSVGMIDSILDLFYEYVDTDPYRAYSEFVDRFYRDMTGKENLEIPWYMVPFAAMAATVIFIVVNLSSAKGRKTTTTRSYVNGGKPDIRRKEDIFIRKNVTSRTIETSSSSGGGHSGGGGGHHTSSGGHSHGGGGHSR